MRSHVPTLIANHIERSKALSLVEAQEAFKQGSQRGGPLRSTREGFQILDLILGHAVVDLVTVLWCRLADIIDNNRSGCRGRHSTDIHLSERFLRGIRLKEMKLIKKKKIETNE